MAGKHLPRGPGGGSETAFPWPPETKLGNPLDGGTHWYHSSTRPLVPTGTSRATRTFTIRENEKCRDPGRSHEPMPPLTGPVVTFDEVGKVYNDDGLSVTALENVSFEISAQRFAMIV